MVYQWLKSRRPADWFAPGCCYLCRAALHEPGLICPACRNDLARTDNTNHGHGHLPDQAIDRIVAPYRYRYPLNQLIRQLKYNQKIILARALSPDISREVLKVCASLPDVVVPIPLHRRRQLLRGYNQAEEIARSVARDLSIPQDNRLLYRSRHTLPQFDLSPAARKRNIKGAFKLRAIPAYGFVALVDDVITTGATVAEAARLLKKAGVKRVEVWACARTDPGG